MKIFTQTDMRHKPSNVYNACLADPVVIDNNGIRFALMSEAQYLKDKERLQHLEDCLDER